MSSAPVIANYQALRGLTERMCALAARADWEAMIELQPERQQLVEAMKPLDATTALDDEARRRKDTLISEILEMEGEIRSAVEVWMAQFRQEIQNSRQELRLLKEYGV